MAWPGLANLRAASDASSNHKCCWYSGSLLRTSGARHSKGEMPEAEPRLTVSQRNQNRKQETGPRSTKEVCEASNIPWGIYIYIQKLRWNYINK